MRKVSEIYEEYEIMPNLREHMLRVAAVASLICGSLKEPLPEKDREVIIKICLLHDMANIVKSEFDVFPPDFYGEKDLGYWEGVKKKFIEKYGDDEHAANAKILEEIGMEKEMIQLADSNRFSFACEIARGDDFSAKIIKYSDFRAAPYGIVSFEERLEEGEKRYRNHPNFLEKEKRDALVECGRDIERQIFSKCRIRPEDINDRTALPIIGELRNFVIK